MGHEGTPTKYTYFLSGQIPGLDRSLYVKDETQQIKGKIRNMDC